MEPVSQLQGHRVAITGGAGFIGSTLATRLTGVSDVVIIDDLSSGRRENLPESTTFLKQDIREVDADDLEGVDYLFHFAANVSIERSVNAPLYDARNNVLGWLSVLEAAMAAGVERVVFSSSSAVYGNPATLPVSESAKIAPASPYAATKRAGEHYASLYTDLYDLETVSLRYFNVYGPRQRGDSPYAGVIAIFIDRLLNGHELTIYGDGEQTRDFVYVSDVVNANLLAATEAQGDGQAYNVGTGTRTSINEIVSVLEELTDTEPGCTHESSREGDIRHSCADIERFRSEVGYEPTVPLIEGLAQTLEWYRRDMS